MASKNLVGTGNIRYIFLWDLDGTLGNFGGLAEVLESMGAKDSGEDASYELPRGIEKVFSRLSVLGENYLVTMMHSSYGNEVLAKTGLNKYFCGVFGGDSCVDVNNDTKHYQNVLKDIGVDNGENARVVVIGNSMYDAPGDISDAVFIWYPDCVNHHFGDLERIISRVILEGDALERDYYAPVNYMVSDGEGFNTKSRVVHHIEAPEVEPKVVSYRAHK